MANISELTPTEFCERWPAGPRDDVTLLDVREPAEWQTAQVAGALHIPMRTVPGRLDELDPAHTWVVMCHGGVRSLRVAEFLAASGYARVFNLTGGIDAWSLEIDSSVPRY
ncbi:MAG: rhodanese-like domain-containing protein [Rhodospirillaceae bacterium]|nr:rhodanese-like domain-containing protein [Rhodospirillaceae bacterium]